MFGAFKSPQFPHSHTAWWSIVQILSGHHPVSFSSYYSICVLWLTIFLAFQVRRYFTDIVHCILLSFFLASISHPTHVTSRQFLTNISLPKGSPSQYRYSKHHLPTSKNRGKVFDIHHWFRSECKTWPLAAKKVNLQFLLIKCWLVHLAWNNVLTEKLITA
jgi:hypothetical protein